MKKRNDYCVLVNRGKTGSRVYDRLKSMSKNVRGVSRSTPIPFDWDNEKTWQEAIENVKSIYLVFTPDLAASHAPKVIKMFVNLAKKLNVEHIVMLSGRGELEAQICENILIESGLKWTVVRASWFNQNFSEGFFREDVLRGESFVPIVQAKEPFVDTDDIAEVVVSCLLDHKHRGKIYELTGPELLSFSDCFKIISERTAMPIKVNEISIQDYSKLLIEMQVPTAYVELLTYLFTQVLDGRNESLRHDISEILGRPANSFRNYVEKTSNLGLWIK